MKPVLTGSMTDLQVKGGQFCRVLEGGGGGYPPLLIGLAAGLQVLRECFVIVVGWGVSPMSRPFFFKKKRPTLIFARKQILSHPIG